MAIKVQLQSKNASNCCTTINNGGLLQMQLQLRQQQHLGNMFFVFFYGPASPSTANWKVPSQDKKSAKVIMFI